MAMIIQGVPPVPGGSRLLCYFDSENPTLLLRASKLLQNFCTLPGVEVSVRFRCSRQPVDSH